MSQIVTVFYNLRTGTFRPTPPKRMTRNFAPVEIDDAVARQVLRDQRNARDRERYRRELAESGTVRWHWTPDPTAKDGAFEGPRFRFTTFLGIDLISEGPAALTVGVNGHARCAACEGTLELDSDTYCVCDRSGVDRKLPTAKRLAGSISYAPDPELKGGKG